jgi:hypothetical protein
MTLSTLTSRTSYPGPGSGPFAFPFRIQTAGDLLVTKRSALGAETTLSNGLDYTVAGVLSASGSVTLTTALVAGETIFIRRAPPLTQTTSIRNQGPYFPATHEDAFDRLTMQMQSLQDQVDRSFRLGETMNPGAFNMTLPNPDAGKVVTGTGTGFTMSTLDSSAVALPGNGRTVPTLSAYLANNAIANVKDFGAKGDGATDDTAAGQAAYNSFPAGNGLVWWPLAPNGYLIAGNLVCNQHRVSTLGSRYGGKLLFAPTADGICLKYKLGSVGTINQFFVRDMTFYSNDSTYTKTGLEIVDGSTYEVGNITVGGSVAVLGTSYWTGGATGSIGVRTRGREAGSYYKIDAAADRPLVISTNPNSSISIDHHTFRDLYLTANAHPCVEAETGINLSSVAFTGHQAWVKGTYGFYWNDTTSVQTSLNLSFDGELRTEQGTDVNAYQIYISHNTSLTGLLIKGLYGGLERNGIYLRKVVDTIIERWRYISTSKIALNVTLNAAGYLKLIGVSTQNGATATLTNMRQQSATFKPFSTSPLPYDAVYTFDNGSILDYQYEGDVLSMSFKGSLANGASIDLRCGTAFGVVLALITAAAIGATKHENGTASVGALGEKLGGGSAGFAVGNTATKLCVWKNGGTTALLNNLGETVTYVATVKATQ